MSFITLAYALQRNTFLRNNAVMRTYQNNDCLTALANNPGNTPIEVQRSFALAQQIISDNLRNNLNYHIAVVQEEPLRKQLHQEIQNTFNTFNAIA